MNFKQYLSALTDKDGFIPTPRFRQVVHQNPRKTAREEAIAAEVLRQANPRESVTGSYPWGPEQQIILQQLWIHPKLQEAQWREIPLKDAQKLYSVVSTEHGELPVPNAILEPEAIQGDFQQRLREILGEGMEDTDTYEE